MVQRHMGTTGRYSSGFVVRWPFEGWVQGRFVLRMQSISGDSRVWTACLIGSKRLGSGLTDLRMVFGVCVCVWNLRLSFGIVLGMI